jgi:putative ubiquitin-RnfH superfamily antitoxin RatB of RatAB toxin-antitoxin module
VDLANSVLGIFGRLTRTDHALQDGDRIEIYRPLVVDPKAARRARAKQARGKP